MNDLPDRLRHRALEVLSLLADGEVQMRYQSSVSHVNVSEELFNQWEEAFSPEDSQFRSAFAEEEMSVLRRVDSVIHEVSENTPKRLPALHAFMQTEAWRRISAAAAAALREIADRAPR